MIWPRKSWLLKKRGFKFPAEMGHDDLMEDEREARRPIFRHIRFVVQRVRNHVWLIRPPTELRMHVTYGKPDRIRFPHPVAAETQPVTVTEKPQHTRGPMFAGEKSGRRRPLGAYEDR